MSSVVDFSGRDICEQTMKDTWEEFKQKLQNKEFAYNEVSIALQAGFLKTFDNAFRTVGYHLNRLVGDVLSDDICVMRAARIKAGDPEPNYERFIPNAAFMTEHNRFSPPGVEWLYLSLSDKNKYDGDFLVVEKCALKECRATEADTFALCEFHLKRNYQQKKIVDLTIANDVKYDDINSKLMCIGERLCSKGEVEAIIKEWVVYTYAKLMSEQLFVRLKGDKSIEYAPFQCLAQYFLSKGFCGIVYPSTVYKNGKNVVLFDKNYATPVGKINKFKVSKEMAD
ncbi:MAG: RES family NAD+ phosphorylase [Ruminococcus sp.]|nr:RES family NAD+ phosphorylase [Ruminococcus sp.]